jgi:hypothetical protein
MAGIKTSFADQFQHQQTGLGGHSGNCHGLWYWQFALKVSMDKRVKFIWVRTQNKGFPL